MYDYRYRPDVTTTYSLTDYPVRNKDGSANRKVIESLAEKITYDAYANMMHLDCAQSEYDRDAVAITIGDQITAEFLAEKHFRQCCIDCVPLNLQWQLPIPIKDDDSYVFFKNREDCEKCFKDYDECEAHEMFEKLGAILVDVKNLDWVAETPLHYFHFEEFDPGCCSIKQGTSIKEFLDSIHHQNYISADKSEKSDNAWEIANFITNLIDPDFDYEAGDDE